MIPEIRASQLPFSLDLVEKCLFWAVISYFVAKTLNLVGISFYMLFFTGLVISFVSVFVIDKIKVNPNGKAVLITGCDTGFGNAVARKLQQLGFTVFAACISKESEGAKKLEQDFSERMLVLKMDVTSDADVEQAISEMQKHLLDSKLWAVITNAGRSTFGQLEWVPIDIYKGIMETNLFGTIRTIKGALPFIRRSKGRIIAVASMIGHFGVASRSAYTSSKWAIEGLVECFRQEMRDWSVKVICIEPGNFVAGTSIFAGDAIRQQGEYMCNNLSEIVRDDYGKDNFDAFVERMSIYSSIGDSNIEPVVNALCDAVTHSFPQTRYQIFSTHEKVKTFIATHLPCIIFDYIYLMVRTFYLQKQIQNS